MRPQLLKVSREPGHSFGVRRDLVPYVNNRWHFHTEAELIHFSKGQGIQFVGDNMKQFKAGDVVSKTISPSSRSVMRADSITLRGSINILN